MSEAFVPHPFGANTPNPRSATRGTPPSSRKLQLVPFDRARSRLDFETGAKCGPAWVKYYQARLRLTDTVVVSTCTLIAFFGHPGAIVAANSRGFAMQLGLAVLAATLWVISLSSFRTREPRTLGLGAVEYKRVAAASNMTAGMLAIVALVLGLDSARWFIIIAYPVGATCLLLNRWLWRRWLTRQRANGHYLSQVLVVGNRTDAETVVRQIDKAPGAAFTVIGTVIDGPAKRIRSGPLKGLSQSFNPDQAADVANALGADAVVVAGHPRGGDDFIHNLAWKLEGTQAELVLARSLANIAGPRIHFRPVEGLPLLHVEIPQFEGGKHVLKRVFDVLVSGVALLLLAPFLLVVAILVKVDSPGPAFFVQERAGRNGRSFKMIKFRSMVAEAESELPALQALNEASGLLFKMTHDPRVTRIGRTLRKYSIDEFPQLWNVLIGDMCLVGPRPPLQSEVQGYEDHVHRRLFIKPGLTGLWQVNGRSNLDWEASVQLDLYYVENWSLIGDIVILWRTLRVLIQPVGAY